MSGKYPIGLRHWQITSFESNIMVYLIQGICFGEYWKNQNCRLAFGKVKLKYLPLFKKF
jgi:hypothetical protein